MIVNLLESISILSTGIESFVRLCLKDLSANIDNINETLSKSLMIVTRLTPIIGYEKAGEIAKKAYETGKTIKEIIKEMGLVIEEDLDELLDPRKMV
jgi:fumarate hydratase class II